MPRKRIIIKSMAERLKPDSRFHSLLVTAFINRLMERGKRSLAEGIFYKAMEMVEGSAHKPALEVFNKAMENVKPLLEVKSRRVGGATYQVPVDIKMDRSISLALRWIRDYARGRKGKTMTQRLTEEILDAYNKTGNALKKKEDTHKMAEANKAFAHLKW
jgi:small subunit ribosomal protein S7